jgi:hypothetical protein
MLRGFRRVLGIAIVLTLGAGESRAQYYEGYGPYGWVGWGGGGGTVQGDFARGLGFFNMGAGIYNKETAEANSINADTIMRWNEFMFLSQQEANRREYLRRERLVHRDAKSGDAVYQRILNKPDDRDIQNGDALNAILTQLTDPRIHSTALRLIRDPIDGKAIRKIPFTNASEAVTMSLHQLSGEGGWPPALQGERFAPERKAYQDAIAKALDEDTERGLSARTLQAINLAARRLRAKLEANKPADKIQYVEAINHIKALIGMSRMLEKPQVDKILAELDSVKETTLGSLLGFMHTYNLRFAPANTPEQRVVYENLYPIMDAARDKVLAEAGVGEDGKTPPKPKPDLSRSATDFFQGMKLEHLEPRSSNDATKP